MTPISMTQGAVGRSTPVAVDNFRDTFNIGLFVVINSGTPTFNIEATPQDMADATPTVWAPSSGLTGLTAGGFYQLNIPCRGLSINVTITGSVTVYVVQSGTR